jgi:hypothetical protein
MDAFIKKHEWCNIAFCEEDGSIRIIYGISEANLALAISDYIEKHQDLTHKESVRHLDIDDKVKIHRLIPIKIS